MKIASRISSLLSAALAVLLASGLTSLAHAEEAPLAGGVSDVEKIMPKLKEGDLIFVQSHTPQAEFLTALTDSHMTHCGLLFKDKHGDWVVYEGAGMNAEDPELLAKWRADEVKHKPDEPADLNIYVRRLKTALPPAQVEKLKAEALKLHHTGYDSDFAWTNAKNGHELIYCSELLYKAYDRALSIQLVTLQTYAQLLAVPANLKKIDALQGDTGEKIRKRIKEAKKDDPVVSPGDLIRNTSILDVVSLTEPSP